jgi:hypothetical protein
MEVDWSERGEYIYVKHRVLPQWADEALNDPKAVVFDPDYNAISGRSVRTIGYSSGAADVLTVITVDEDGTVYGVNGWKANSRDRRYYNQGGPDEQES